MIEFYRYSELKYYALVTAKTNGNRDNEAIAIIQIWKQVITTALSPCKYN
jgi:hypothetical protein